jgi:hypothetical protein
MDGILVLVERIGHIPKLAVDDGIGRRQSRG